MLPRAKRGKIIDHCPGRNAFLFCATAFFENSLNRKTTHRKRRYWGFSRFFQNWNNRVKDNYR